MFSNKGLENKKIKRIGNEIEPEEILWDTLAKKKEDIFEKKLEVPIMRWPLKLIFFLFFALLIFVSARVFYFQVFQEVLS